MHGNIDCVLLTLASTLIILPQILNCPYPSTCLIFSNVYCGALNLSSNSYKFDIELMIRLVEILWGTRYLSSLLITITFVQVQHINKLPNNSSFVVSKLDIYFANYWILFLVSWKVCDLNHCLSQATHSCIGESLFYIYIINVFYFYI